MGISLGIGGIALGSSGSGYWTPPFKSDALFWLDGTVTGTDAVDNINGWLFPITGTIDWTISQKIFPFKTLCTISAPANGTAAATAIQAKDVNNFWYASDGTANVIPFTMLYQNIDFADKCFCKHVVHSVDSNNIELIPAGVKQVVLYNSAQTANIAQMITAFGAEVQETAGAKYADFVNGNDANAGTFALPYKTITYAITNSADNGLVYCKTGTYSETGACSISRPIKLTGIGNVIINSGHATLGIYHGANNSEITGISQTQSKATGNSTNGVKTGIIYKRCYINNSGGVGFNINSIIITDSIDKSSTTAIQKTTNATIPITINGSYICSADRGIYLLDTNVNLLTFNNSKIITIGGTHQLLALNGATTITANDCIFSGYYISFAPVTSVTGSINIKNSLLENTGTTFSVFDTLNSLLSSVILDKCVFKAAANQLVRCMDVLDVSFINNKCISQGNAKNVTVWVNTATVSSVIDIHNNIINVIGDKSPIVVGDDTFVRKDKITGIIKNNKIFTDVGTAGAGHGLCVWANKGIEIAYNRIEGWLLSIVLKGGNCDYATNPVHNNLCINGRIVIKGVSNTPIINNTIIATLAETQGIYCLVDELGNEALGTVIKNNIVINSFISNTVELIWLAGNSTATIDYNIYYSEVAKPFYKGATAYTFAEWQALGYDAHSIMLTTMAQVRALFNDFDNADYSLKAGSLAIGTGETLDAAYDDGLDASTIFGDGTELPAVVTKQQGALWDIGAYIH